MMIKMSSSIWSFLLLCGTMLVLRSDIVTAMPADCGPLLDNIQKKYASLSSLKADFEQTSFQAMLQETVAEKGWLVIQKPDKMVWTYTSPKTKIALVRDQVFWFYIPDDKHLYCEQTNNYAQNLFYQLISGTIKLKDTFEFSVDPDKGDTAESGLQQLKLKPLEQHPTIQSIMISVDNQFLIRKTIIQDHFGNVTTCLLNNYVIDPVVPDTTFRLELTKPLTITDFSGAKLAESIIDQNEAVSFITK